MPTRRLCFGLGAKPEFSLRFVDRGLAVATLAGHEVDAVASLADVAFDAAASGRGIGASCRLLGYRYLLSPCQLLRLALSPIRWAKNSVASMVDTAVLPHLGHSTDGPSCLTRKLWLS